MRSIGILRSFHPDHAVYSAPRPGENTIQLIRQPIVCYYISKGFIVSLEDRYLREVPPTKVGFPHFSTPLLTAKDKPLRFPRFLKSTSRTGILRSYHPDHVFIVQKTTSSSNESTTPIETTNDIPL